MTADPIVPIDAANNPTTRRPRTAFGWFWTFARSRSPYYRPSDRSAAHPLPWPPGFDPVKNPVFSRNVLEIPAPPTEVFSALCAATEWPAFYPNAADVVIEEGREQRLRAGAHFTWRTFSTRQASEVVLFDADRALGWTADSPGTRAFHRWILEPVAEGTRLVTRLVTEECQFGPATWLDAHWMSRSLSATHQIWLERLRARLAGGG
jgi:ribosome-associated toxin RatA of RatAB toxin-antitoxin module